MWIEKIVKKTGNNSLYELHVKSDVEQVTVEVDEHVLVTLELRKGLELDSQQLKTVVLENQKRIAYLKAIQYLSYKMRTCHEIEQHLLENGILSDITSETVQRLIDQGYVNDYTYSEMYVRDSSEVKKKGPHVIRQELHTKGISRTLIDTSLQQYTLDLQIKNAQHWLDKKRENWAKFSRLEQERKLSALLQRKGFSLQLLQQLKWEDEGENEKRKQFLQQLVEKYERKYRALPESQKQFKVKSALYRKGYSLEEITEIIQCD